MNLNNKIAIIYDFGLNVELAVRLAKDFKKIYYFCEWREGGFPSVAHLKIGYGLEGVERIDNFWAYIDKADLVIFPDTYCYGEVEYLKKKGYRIFGAGKSELLENDRWKCKQIMKKLGLPVQHTVRLRGFQKLIEYLKANSNKVIKINTCRGTIETFVHKEYNTTEAQFLGELLLNAGCLSEEMDFIVEDILDGNCEPGYDGFVIDGNYPNITMWGFEQKGTGYIGEIKKYNEIPQSMKSINDKLAPVFKKLGGRTFFSTEVIITKNKKGYLIDPTVRTPLPVPTAIHLEIWDNLSEFIWNAAEGKLIDLKPKAKYGAGICIDSDWAIKHSTEIVFDYKYRQWIKLRMGCKIDNKYFALPGFSSVCSVIRIGNDIDKIIKEIKKITDTIEIKESSYTISGLEDIVNKVIPESKIYGINF